MARNGGLKLISGKIVGNEAAKGGVYFESTNYESEISGGEIYENSASQGAGMYIAGTCTVTMSGGEMYRNIALHGQGGAVYVDSYDRETRVNFAMTGGSIHNNRAEQGGGVYLDCEDIWWEKGTFQMTGGTIRENDARQGAGVYASGNLLMSGGSITENYAYGYGSFEDSQGSGVYVTGVDTAVSGNVTIAGNRGVGQIASNVYLVDGFTLEISGALNNAASIGIDAENRPTIPGSIDTSPLTSGLNGKGSLQNFFFDGQGYNLEEEYQGEIYLRKHYTWAEVQQRIDTYNYMFLVNDVVAGAQDGPLVIPEGKEFTLDLQGYNLDRGLADQEPQADGCVIRITGGKLTLEDGSDFRTASVTGGNSTGDGGGIAVESGELVMSSSRVAGNSARDGGGVYVSPAGPCGCNTGRSSKTIRPVRRAAASTRKAA